MSDQESVLSKRKTDDSSSEDDNDSLSLIEEENENNKDSEPINNLFQENALNEMNKVTDAIQESDNNNIPIILNDETLTALPSLSQLFNSSAFNSGNVDIGQLLNSISSAAAAGNNMPAAKVKKRRGPKPKMSATLAIDKRRASQKIREGLRRDRAAKSMLQLGALCGATNADKSFVLLRAIEGLKYQAKRIKIYEDALQIPVHVSNSALSSLLNVMQLPHFVGSPVQLLAIHTGNQGNPYVQQQSLGNTPVPHVQTPVQSQQNSNTHTTAAESNFDPNANNMFSNFPTAECYLKVSRMDESQVSVVRNALNFNGWINLDIRVMGLNELAQAQLGHVHQIHMHFAEYFSRKDNILSATDINQLINALNGDHEIINKHNERFRWRINATYQLLNDSTTVYQVICKCVQID